MANQREECSLTKVVDVGKMRWKFGFAATMPQGAFKHGLQAVLENREGVWGWVAAELSFVLNISQVNSGLWMRSQ